MANFAFESLAPDRPQDESWIDHGEIEHFKRLLLLLLLLSLLSRRPVTKFRHHCDHRVIVFRLSSRIWVQVGSCRFGALSNFRQKMSHNENPTLWNIYFRTVWTFLKTKFTLEQHWNVLTIFWLCPSFSEGGKIINILVSHPVQRFCRGKIKTASGNKFKHSELILATYDFSKIESNYMYERIDGRKILFLRWRWLWKPVLRVQCARNYLGCQSPWPRRVYVELFGRLAAPPIGTWKKIPRKFSDSKSRLKASNIMNKAIIVLYFKNVAVIITKFLVLWKKN